MIKIDAHDLTAIKRGLKRQIRRPLYNAGMDPLSRVVASMQLYNKAIKKCPYGKPGTVFRFSDGNESQDVVIDKIRISRLRPMSSKEVTLEGFKRGTLGSKLQSDFKARWDELNPNTPWRKDPWVWVITFTLWPRSSRIKLWRKVPLEYEYDAMLVNRVVNLDHAEARKKIDEAEIELLTLIGLVRKARVKFTILKKELRRRYL